MKHGITVRNQGEALREKIWQILHDHKREDEWATVVVEIYQAFKEAGGVFLDPNLAFELDGTKLEYQTRLAELLNFASSMGDYGDPYGLLAVISPTSGKVLKVEGDIVPAQGKLQED